MKRLSGKIVHAALALSLAGMAALGIAKPTHAGGGGVIWYVKWNASGANNGTSWANAFTSLQSALAVAASPDNIWVAQGTYKPGTTRLDTFEMVDGVQIYGGFAGTETLFSQRNPALHPTILSGDIGTAGVTTDNSYHVVHAAGILSGSILDGFTVKSGNANSGSNLNDKGGGMLIDGANPTVKNIIFTANLAVYGGGFYANSGNVTLTNVTFSGNHASSGGGGGLFSWNSGPTLTNVTFKGNSTTGSGGAIYGYGSVPILINVTMTGNNASLLGDGIFSIAGGGPDIRDSILWADGTQEVSNSSTTATIHNSTVKGGCPASSTCVGILGSNPLLGTLKNNGGFTTTMALGAGSPAIDHGNNASCASTDQRGFARPQGPKCDMGAYEVRVATYPSVGSYDGWLLESAVNSGTGGSMNASSTTVRLGDDAANRQYRSLFSFNTAPLPDAAAIVLARVRLDKQGLVGTNPFTTHGALTMDLAKPYFGSAVSLATNDFQAGYTVAGAGTVSSTPSGAWYTGTLNHSGYTAVNKTGTTQLRLRFNLHSNLDNGADYLAFYSGNASSAQRPQLLVYYNP